MCCWACAVCVWGCGTLLWDHQACIAFQKGQFAQARELYASVIQENPGCPSAVRVGLGMCLYKLGHIEAAKKAFIRALQMDVSAAALGAGECAAVVGFHG